LSMRTTLSREMQHAPRMRILSGLIKRIYNHADALIVPSELAARDLISSFHIDESKLHVIYNYVDPLVIDQLCNEPISDRNHSELFLHPVLLNVGRITPAKGQWLMLHVLQRLRKQNSQLKFVIIGEGESEKDFKQKLVNYALNLDLKIYDSYSDQVFSIDYDVYLLGFDSNPFRYMKQSSLLVFPSTFEGFPNTVIEAMQSKLAVIAADCQSGPREILAPQTDPSAHTAIVEFADYGILAPSLPSSSIEDPVEERIIAEWIKAINALLEDPKLQTHYIEKGLQRASAFEKDIILQEWKEILDGIGQP
ncbi:MAG: glycosyltransferase, partial [Flavisolibacter sp.]